MKRIIIAVIVSIVIIIFTFSTGLWLGINYEPFKVFISDIYKGSTAEYATKGTGNDFSVEFHTKIVSCTLSGIFSSTTFINIRYKHFKRLIIDTKP